MVGVKKMLSEQLLDILLWDSTASRLSDAHDAWFSQKHTGLKTPKKQ